MDQLYNEVRISREDAKPINSTKRKNMVPVKVEYLDKMDPDALYYDLTGKGLAVIFNHTHYYANRYSERSGSDNDAEKLEYCLLNLNFSCKIYDNSTIYDIQNIMESVSNLSLKDLSCLIIIVMTHGTSKKLAAYDGDYNRSMLWEKLVGKLIGIPKLFFIQACRGERVDKGVEVTDSIGYKTDDARFTLPEMADYLFMYSSYEGYISWSEESGSWFIQSLCEVLEDKHKEWDLLQMLTYVCKKVAINYESRSYEVYKNKTKSIPQIVSTLTKFLKFKPKSEKNKEAKLKEKVVQNKKSSPDISYRLYILICYKFLFHYLCMKLSN